MILDMSIEEHYDIAAAIRGPDQPELYSLKSIFTYPIRYVVTGSSIWKPFETPFDMDDADRFLKRINQALKWVVTKGDEHYLSHIQSAARALGLTYLVEQTFGSLPFTQEDFFTIWAEAEALVTANQ